VIAYVVYTIFVISCLILILVVLLQPGKGDVASALGGGISGAAFGPRGTTSLLAKITIVAAALFMGIAFAFSIPGVVTPRSVTSGVAVPEETETQPATPAPAEAPGEAPAEGTTPEGETPAVPPGTSPAGAIHTDENGRIPAQSVEPAGTATPDNGAAPAAQKKGEKPADAKAKPSTKKP
jgi:preprotein translocase subunit SecG